MDIQAEKIELIKLLWNTNNPSILESIKNILAKEKQSDFWNDLSEEQKNEIDQADLEIKNGETFDFNEFMANHR